MLRPLVAYKKKSVYSSVEVVSTAGLRNSLPLGDVSSHRTKTCATENKPGSPPRTRATWFTCINVKRVLLEAGHSSIALTYATGGANSNSRTFGGISLDLDQTSSTRFLVGTDQGQVLWCNRKGKSQNDRIVQVYSGHHGPIYSVQRNPFFNRYFLSVGDWTAKIFTEELHSPIMSTKYHNAYLTDGCWSPTRPGVFLTARRDGVLDIWDYMYKTNDPALSVQVCKEALSCLAPTPQGILVAAGGVDGSTTLLRLVDGLAVMQSNEKATVNQMFERETRREKNHENQGKEARAFSKMHTGGDLNTSTHHTNSNGDLRTQLEQVEQEFNQIVNLNHSN